MSESKVAVIIGAAKIEKYESTVKHIEEIAGKRERIYVYCDAGLKHEDGLQYTPDIIVGDFDSHENPHRDIETIVLPTMKDDTDTVYAVKEALKRGYNEIILVGVIGQRFDHSLGNLSILLYLMNNGAKGYIIDDYSLMEAASKEPVYIDDSYRFYSVVAAFGPAYGVHEENAKYLLDGAKITPDYQYGVSNEVLEGLKAKVWCEEGTLLVIKDFE